MTRKDQAVQKYQIAYRQLRCDLKLTENTRVKTEFADDDDGKDSSDPGSLA